MDLLTMKIKITDYASTQFNLPEGITNKIDEYFKNLIDKKDIADSDILPDYAKDGIVTNKAHITVLYGIKEDMEKVIGDLLKDKEEVSAILGTTKVFENSFLDYDVLYIEVMSLGIRRIRSILQKEIEYVSSPFSFTPHVTVAYLKKGTSNKYIGDNQFERTHLKLNSLIYTPVEGEDTVYLLKNNV